MLLLLVTFLAIFPQWAFVGLGFILALELVSGRAEKPVQHQGHPILVLAFFTAYMVQVLYGEHTIWDLGVLTLLLASIGLSVSHEIAHRYNLFHLSVYYKIHIRHHGQLDPEKPLRKMSIVGYAGAKIKMYLFSRATFWDAAWFALFAFSGWAGVGVYFAALFIVELIGYVQHDRAGRAVDFKNWGDNALFYNAGFHSDHHREKASAEYNSGVMLGLLATLVFMVIHPLSLTRAASIWYNPKLLWSAPEVKRKRRTVSDNFDFFVGRF